MTGARRRAYPSIACLGTIGRYPFCRPVITAPMRPEICPPGTVGHYPVCRPKRGDNGEGGSTAPTHKTAVIRRELSAGHLRPLSDLPSASFHGRWWLQRCFPRNARAPERLCPPGTFGHYPVCRPLRRGGEAGPLGTTPEQSEGAARACPPGTFGQNPVEPAMAAPTVPFSKIRGDPDAVTRPARSAISRPAVLRGRRTAAAIDLLHLARPATESRRPRHRRQ
jgi:hypothetical protein